MATDGPTPPPCDLKLFQEGETVFISDTIGFCAIERWVQKIAATSGQPVDWHWADGRANILALGDLSKVRLALAKHMAEYNELHAAACANLGL